ncbi:MAG: 50S ribosomal protein L9 [Alphaproteobacteria bacterium]
MQVILLERVEKLGGMGQVVNVKSGYARNYLIPQGKALRATTENLERFEGEHAELEAANRDRRKHAEGVADKIVDAVCVLLRQASDSLQLYGSVTARDIAASLAEKGFEVDRKQVLIEAPIKTIGVHKVRAALHPEVIVPVKVTVARSPEEAEQLAQEAEASQEAKSEDVAEPASAAAGQGKASVGTESGTADTAAETSDGSVKAVARDKTEEGGA